MSEVDGKAMEAADKILADLREQAGAAGLWTRTLMMRAVRLIEEQRRRLSASPQPAPDGWREALKAARNELALHGDPGSRAARVVERIDAALSSPPPKIGEAKELQVFDQHPDSPRVMFETPDGVRFTEQQWALHQFTSAVDAKLDLILSRLNGAAGGDGR